MANEKIDKSIWLTMGLAAFMALIALAFKAATYENCDHYKLTISKTHNEAREAGKSINFAINATNDEVWWDFGDGTEVKKGKEVQHTYFQSGIYTVIAKIKGNCRLFENVLIIPPYTPSQQELQNFTGPIYGAHEIPAGSSLQLASTKAALSYQWTVQGHPEIARQFERNAGFVFTIPGVYMIELILDSNSAKVYTHEVNVGAPEVSDILSSPVLPDAVPLIAPGPAPTVAVKMEKDDEVESEIAAKRFLTITDAEMKLLLGELAESKKTLADFNSYLCNGANTKTIANGKATVFAELIGKLQDKKGILGIGGKRKIQRVKQTFDSANGNCVLVLTVDFK